MTNLFDPPKRVDVDLSPYADQNAYAIGGAWEVEARRQGWSAAGNNQMSMLHKPTQIQLTQMFASGTRHHHQEALKVEMANKLKEINYWQTNYGG